MEISYQIVSTAHIGAAIAAMGTGLAVVLLRKGTRAHKQFGYTYVASMLALNLSALQIYRLTGTFGLFHALALLSLATLMAGFVPVFMRWPSQRWLETHLRFMAWSYIGLLAAAVAETAVRVPSTPFWPAVALSALLVSAVGGWILAKKRPVLLARYA